ncbi:putative ATP-dependent RNA helicase DDX56 [Nibea albiflora]|uniref:ATP-dependent RNA helicase DDX56 n=1 Tax=Nibea albiflora TaxID=240163 RepID=A0ACB7F7H9_NIBAL|nr:putative ATP-dependent RNA helicase DDX56 [Nibea albiflora]
MAAERLQFHEMGLDDRLLKAVADLGWSQPTLIQEKAIPLALEGKDLLARSPDRIWKDCRSVREQDVRALILVPTKELGQQVQAMIRQLTAYCSRDVRVADISGKADLSAQRPILMEKPDVVVGTPSRVLAHLSAQNLVLHSSLETLVVDEADLLFSFGFEADLKSLLCHLPKIYQSFLMSATLTEDVQALKELLLHNPVTKLHVPLHFTAALLTGRHPSRTVRSVWCHIITQFNQGFYDYIIATDEQSLADPTAASQAPAGQREEEEGDRERRKVSQIEKRRDEINGVRQSCDWLSKDKEYGVSRGVDFQNVANVINFDFPTTVESYIHRVGRTARADNPGTALSFIAHTELALLSDVEEALTGDHADSALKPYEFKMEEIEGFRYRCRDAMRSVTKQAVKEARLKEIKQELLNSEKLKTYFEDNPRDLQLLRHDKDLHPAVIKPHLKNVPEYLVPETLRSTVNLSGRRRRKRKEKPKAEGVIKTSFKNIQGKNPLKSFRYTGGRHRKGKAGRS